jgi:phosphoheptose isomerase
MSTSERDRKESKSMNPVLAQNIQEASALFASLARFDDQVQQSVDLIAETLGSGHKLLACGNGGSAADAAHMTTEFVVRFVRDRRAYPAICLNSQGGDLTAIGNDYGFDQLFARQVTAFAQPGDVLVVFTTSGQSANIVYALEAAKRSGIKTIAFLGRDGGKCKGLADIEMIVEHNTTARIQEAHQLLLHTICEMFEIKMGHAPARE